MATVQNSFGRVGRRTVLIGLAAGAAACSAPTEHPATASSATTLPATATSTTPAPTGTAGASSATTATPTAATPTADVLRTPGPDIASGPTTVNAVALTFHGQGDIALAHRVLEVAAAHGAHLTVFAVGQWLTATPSIGREIVAAGHDLGNHTWSHRAMTHLGAAGAASEISRGADAVRSAVGSPGLLFRPSGTPTSTATIRAAAAQSGYARCISYDVDPLDYTDPGAAAVTSRTLAAVRPGSIISLHLGHAGTADALPAILEGLAAAHLEPVTLTRLLATG